MPAGFKWVAPGELAMGFTDEESATESPSHAFPSAGHTAPRKYPQNTRITSRAPYIGPSKPTTTYSN